MAIYSSTKTVLRHDLAKLVDDYLVATADANTSTTSIVDTETGMFNADHFNGWEACGYGLTGAPVSIVTDFAVAAGVGTLTIAPAMTGMASTVAYELHDRESKWPKAQLDMAINMAINHLAYEILLDKVDESLTLATSDWEYNLPTGFVALRQIYLETSTAGKYEGIPIPYRCWRILGAATPAIVFDTDDWTPTNGRKLRLIGQAKQAALSVEADICTLPPQVVLDFALAYLMHIKGRWAEANAAFAAAEAKARAYKIGPVGRVVRV